MKLINLNLNHKSTSQGLSDVTKIQLINMLSLILYVPSTKIQLTKVIINNTRIYKTKHI